MKKFIMVSVIIMFFIPFYAHSQEKEKKMNYCVNLVGISDDTLQYKYSDMFFAISVTTFKHLQYIQFAPFVLADKWRIVEGIEGTTSFLKLVMPIDSAVISVLEGFQPIEKDSLPQALKSLPYVNWKVGRTIEYVSAGFSIIEGVVFVVETSSEIIMFFDLWSRKGKSSISNFFKLNSGRPGYVRKYIIPKEKVLDFLRDAHN